MRLRYSYSNRASPVDASTSSVASQHEPTYPPDPIIPAINEYGTFGRSSASLCSSAEESERLFLFPSAPTQPSRPKILMQLIPFSSFFSSILSAASRERKSDTSTASGIGQADISCRKNAAQRRGRHYRSSGPKFGPKFRPKIAGGGGNVPLKILLCLSDWLAVLDERGVFLGLYCLLTLAMMIPHH